MGSPERSCVVCRKRAVKDNLLRFVIRDGTPELDLFQAEPGRGAYCHAVVGCALARGVEGLLRMMLASEEADSKRERRKRVRAVKRSGAADDGSFAKALLKELKAVAASDKGPGFKKQRFKKLLQQINALCKDYEAQQGTEQKQSIRL